MQFIDTSVKHELNMSSKLIHVSGAPQLSKCTIVTLKVATFIKKISQIPYGVILLEIILCLHLKNPT